MAKFFVGNEFPTFKPIKATPEKVLPLLDGKIVELEAALASAPASEKVKLQKDVNYAKELKAFCVENPGKAVYFTKEQAKLVGLV